MTSKILSRRFAFGEIRTLETRMRALNPTKKRMLVEIRGCTGVVSTMIRTRIVFDM